MWLGTVWQTISSDEHLIRLPVAFAGRFGAPMTNSCRQPSLRPERLGELARSETIPSRCSLQAWAKNLGPSHSAWLENQIGLSDGSLASSGSRVRLRYASAGRPGHGHPNASDRRLIGQALRPPARECILQLGEAAHPIGADDGDLPSR